MAKEESAGTILSLKSGQWKGGSTHNGTLKKLHDFSFTEGYSSLTYPTLFVPEFGYGVFEDASTKDNKVQTMVAGLAAPVFGGVLVRSPGLASGQPAANTSVLSYNKVNRVKRGFVVFKRGWTLSNVEQGWADITKRMNLFISNTTGRPFFSVSNTVSGATIAGKIIAINPDDKSWTVEVGNAEAMALGVSSVTLSQITDLADLHINQLDGVNFTTLTVGQILKADATGVLVPAVDAT
jgi:hypothetical protein